MSDSKLGDFGSQRIRPAGGRRQPKTSEHRDAAADRIIRLLEKGEKGCRLTAPFPELDSRDIKRIKEHEHFAAADKDTRLEILNDKLVDLYDKKILCRDNKKKLRRINKKIERIQEGIAELLASKE